jgi:hypothetical protein
MEMEPVFAALLLAWFAVRSGAARTGLARHGLREALDLLVALGQQMLAVSVGGQRLLECEQVFGSIVAGQRLSLAHNMSGVFSK